MYLFLLFIYYLCLRCFHCFMVLLKLRKDGFFCLDLINEFLFRAWILLATIYKLFKVFKGFTFNIELFILFSVDHIQLCFLILSIIFKSDLLCVHLRRPKLFILQQIELIRQISNLFLRMQISFLNQHFKSAKRLFF